MTMKELERASLIVNRCRSIEYCLSILYGYSGKKIDIVIKQNDSNVFEQTLKGDDELRLAIISTLEKKRYDLTKEFEEIYCKPVEEECQCLASKIRKLFQRILSHSVQNVTC